MTEEQVKVMTQEDLDDLWAKLKSWFVKGSSGVTDGAAVAFDGASGRLLKPLGYTPFNNANFTKANIKSTLGISDWALAASKPSYAFSEITGTASDNQIPTLAISKISGLQTALDGKLATSLKGAANGLAELDANGLVPSSQLPSYVDDVLEYASKSAFPATGTAGKIYVALDTNLTYRWSGSAYVEISPSLALGETSSTAYRGDRGKTAYDHATETKSGAQNSGFYKFSVTAQGHISGVSAVIASDLTSLIGSTTYAPYNANGYLPLSGGTITGSTITPLIIQSTNNNNYITFQLKSKNHYRNFGLDENGDLFITNLDGWANEYKIWHTGNMGAGSGLNADKVDGLHASELYVRGEHRYGLENYIYDIVRGGQTTRVDDDTITTSGTTTDTYFFIKTTENLVPDEIYTFGFYVEGYTGTGTWTFYCSNNATCIKIDINKNGWVWGTGTAIPSGGTATSQLLIDDAGPGNARALTFSKFIMVKGYALPAYVKAMRKQTIGYASALTTDAGGATTPVYFSNGVPVACTSYANASVASAGKATNDSDGNAINTTYLKKSGGTMTGALTGTTIYGDYVQPRRLLINHITDPFGTDYVRGCIGYQKSSVPSTCATPVSRGNGIYFSASATADYSNIIITALSGIYLDGTVKINGNTAWHAGNDGSGSGLDADLLDGQHGSYYATASSVTTLQGYFTSGVANSAAKLTTVSKTAWGQTFWTSGGIPATISGDMSSVGTITPSADKQKNLGSESLQFQYLYASRLITNSGNGLRFCATTGKHGWYNSYTTDSTTKQMELDANSNLTVQGDVMGMGGVSAMGIASMAINSVSGVAFAQKIATNGQNYTASDGTITLPNFTDAYNPSGTGSTTQALSQKGAKALYNAVIGNIPTTSTVAGWGYKKGMVYSTSTTSDSGIQVATGADPTYQYITNTSQSSLVMTVTTDNAAANSYGVHRYIMIYNNRSSATLVQFADQGQGVVGPADSVSIPANSYMEFRIIHPASNAKCMVTWSTALKNIDTM